MNVLNCTDEDLVKKLRGLSPARLEHAIQLLKLHVQRYEVAIENYNAEQLEKYGKPHLARLHRRVELAEEELGRRS